MIIDAQGREVTIYNPAIDKRKPAYENEMTKAVNLIMTCNSCDRIIFEDENWIEGYEESAGYCRECADETKEVIKVKFLVHSIIGEYKGKIETFESDIFAYFPEEKFNDDPGMFTAYSHIGQHSACHVDYANESRPATPEEYSDLKTELESIGYKLEIL